LRAGTLVVDIAANVARLQQDMAQAKGVVESTMRDISRAASVAGGVLASLGVGVSVAGIANIARESIKATAALDDMAEVTGASVEQLSRLQVVARTGGQDLGAVQDGLVRLTKGLKGTEEESKNATAALGFLGVKAKDLSGNLRDPGELMQEIAVRLNKFEDGAGKTALALDLFGKSGANLLPFLKDLAEAGQVNARVTAAQAAQAEVFEKNLKRLTQASEDAKREFVIGITPALVKFTEELLAAQKAGFGLAEALSLVMKFRMGMGTPEEIIADADRRIATWSNPGWGAKGVAEGMADAQARRRFGLALQARAALEGRTGGAFMDSRDLRVHGPRVAADYAGAGDKGGRAEKPAVFGWAAEVDRARDQAGKELGEIAKQNAEALKLEADALRAATEQWIARNNAIDGAQQATRDQVRELEFEISLIGKSTAEREVAIAQRRIDAEMRVAIAALQKDDNVVAGETILKVMEETEARKKLVGELINTRVAKEEAQKAGEDAAKKYKEGLERQSDSISRTITDALMRGFEGGKDWAANFRDTLKNMFKTLVLEPMIRPVGQAVAGGMNSLLGTSAQAGAGNGNGGMSIGDLLNYGKKGYDFFFGGGGGMAGSASSASMVAGWGVAEEAAMLGIAGEFGGTAALTAGAFGGTVASGAAIGGVALAGEAAALGIGSMYAGGAAAAGVGAAGAAGMGAAAAGLAAIPVAGWIALAALAVMSMMDDGGGGPKNSELTARWASTGDPLGRRKGMPNNGVGHPFLAIGSNNLPGSEANTPYLRAMEAEFADPTKYDQQMISEMFSSTSWASIMGEPGESAQSMMNKIKKRLEPARINGGARTAQRTALEMMRNPGAYWRGEMEKLQAALGTSAASLSTWREAFLTAMEGPLSEATFAKWQALGAAIEQATGAAGRAVGVSSFRTAVDFRRYNAMGGADPVAAPAPGDFSSLSAEMRAMRVEMQAANIAIARNTSATARVLTRFERDALPVRALDPTQPIAVVDTPGGV
jgi:hypothetical protein